MKDCVIGLLVLATCGTIREPEDPRGEMRYADGQGQQIRNFRFAARVRGRSPVAARPDRSADWHRAVTKALRLACESAASVQYSAIGLRQCANREVPPMRFPFRMIGFQRLLALSIVAGCAHEVQGPAPRVATVAPSVACSVEVATQVLLTGSGFSPVMGGALTLEPQARLPKIRLERTQLLDGSAASGAFDVPDDPTRIEESDVEWRDAMHMAFWICPPGSCSAATPRRQDYVLDPGIYGVRVANPDGRSATIATALTVVPPPDVARIVPEVPCSDRDETLTLNGDWLLRVGDVGGTVHVGTKVFAPTLSDCRLLPQVSGPPVHACKTATVVVPKGALAPGIYDVVWAGPTGAACHSTTASSVTFVPAPAVAQVPTDLLSIAGHAATVTVDGSGFLSVAGLLPTVVLDAKHEVPATSVAQCEAVSGPSQKVWRCKRLSATVPKDFVPAGNYAIHVRNPAPADATSSSTAALTLVGSPQLNQLGSQVTCDAQMDREIVLHGKGFLTVDGVAPTARIGAGAWISTEAVAASCAALPGARPGIRQCSQLRLGVAQGSLDPGIYPVEVTNPLPADTTSTHLELTVVPPPGLAGVSVDVACNQQGPVKLLLTGDHFLDVDGQMPTVSVGGQSLGLGHVVKASCDAVKGPSLPTLRCTQLEFVLPQGALPVGKHQIVVHNPQPAECGSGTADLTILAPPHVTQLMPDVQCTSTSQLNVALTGEGFLTIDGQLPLVHLGDQVVPDAMVVQSSCVALPGVAANVKKCTKIQLALPKDGLVPANYPVTVENPQPVGCDSAPVDLTIVPPPTVAALDGDVRCSAQGGITLKLTGDHFYTVAGKAPSVTIGTKKWSTTAATASSCTTVAGPVGAIQRCTELTLALPQAALPPGHYPVGVENALPGDCASTGPELTVVAPPALGSAGVDLVCNAEGAVDLQLSGASFLQIGAVKPTVKIGTSLLPVTSLAGCLPLAGVVGAAQQCSSLTVTVPKGTLPPGASTVAVINPVPAGCVTTESKLLTVLGPPIVASTAMPAVCLAQGTATLTVTGSGFLKYGNDLPQFKIAGQTFAASHATGCKPLSTTGGPAQVCTGVDATIPKGAAGLGPLAVYIQNPSPAACTSLSGAAVVSTPPPTLTQVLPTTLCQSGGTLSLSGGPFGPDAKVSLGKTQAQSVSVSGTSVTAKFGTLSTADKSQPITLTNADGCMASLPDAVAIVAPISVYLVEPPVVHNSLSTELSILISGAKTAVQSVTLAPAGSTDTPVTLQLLTPSKPGRVRAVVPKGMAAGVYDLVVSDGGLCPGLVPGGLRVVDGLSVVVTAVSPAVAAFDEPTDLAITGAGFQATPRVYLAPAGAAAPVAPLRSVGYRDGSKLTAVVPAGLASGLYDVLVVHADGSAGALPGGLRIAAAPLPAISHLEPPAVPAAGTPTSTVFGSHFATGSGAATVSLLCVDGAGTAIGPAVSATTGATLECPAPAAGCIGFAVPTASLAGAAACTVRVTNPLDGASADFAALTLSQPALGLGVLQAGPPLQTARRALATVAARAASGARFLYAIGGDSGATSGPLGSVETAQIDATTGKLGAWRTLPFGLPAPRTWLSAAAIGNAIYVVGGHDGTAPRSEVLRAFVLDPLQVPRISDVDYHPSTGTGVAAGTWSYRVSAVRGAGDPANPGGETLASPPVPVWLPSPLRVTLTWKPLPGAASYRIYRTPLPDLATGVEQLLATVPAATPSFEDTGSATTAAAPLPPGSTTQWQPLASLTTPRAAPGLARVADPNDPNLFYLHAVGGLADTVTAAPSIESLRVSIVGETQIVDGAWTTQATGLAPSRQRWQLGTWVANHDLIGDVPAGKVYLYAGGGISASGAAINDVDVFTVLPTGKLGARVSVSPFSGGGAAGYGVAVGNGGLYAIGGSGGAPSASLLAARLCAGADGACLGPAPALPTDAWSALVTAFLSPAGVWMGSVQDGAYLLLCGGATGSQPATSQTWSTIW